MPLLVCQASDTWQITDPLPRFSSALREKHAPLPECGGLISAVQRMRWLFPWWLSGETANFALLHPDGSGDFFGSYCLGVHHGYNHSTRKNHSDNLHGWPGVERRTCAGCSSRERRGGDIEARLQWQSWKGRSLATENPAGNHYQNIAVRVE